MTLIKNVEVDEVEKNLVVVNVQIKAKSFFLELNKDFIEKSTIYELYKDLVEYTVNEFNKRSLQLLARELKQISF